MTHAWLYEHEDLVSTVALLQLDDGPIWTVYLDPPNHFEDDAHAWLRGKWHPEDGGGVRFEGDPAILTRIALWDGVAKAVHIADSRARNRKFASYIDVDLGGIDYDPVTGEPPAEVGASVVRQFLEPRPVKHDPMSLVRYFGADRPRIVVLCGSTRFYDQFQEANYSLTMAGSIVLSVGFYPHAKAEHGHGEGVGHDSVEKDALDELHLRKIDLADSVFVVNVGGYIGESTRREIEYAEKIGRAIVYLEPDLVEP
jgi:hypothetical protein